MDYILKELVSRVEKPMRKPKKIVEQYTPEGKMIAWVAPLKETHVCEKTIEDYKDFMIYIARDAINTSASVLRDEIVENPDFQIEDVTIVVKYPTDDYRFAVELGYCQIEKHLGILAVIGFDEEDEGENAI